MIATFDKLAVDFSLWCPVTIFLMASNIILSFFLGNLKNIS